MKTKKTNSLISIYADMYGVAASELTIKACKILGHAEEYSRDQMVTALVSAGVKYDVAEEIAANK